MVDTPIALSLDSNAKRSGGRLLSLDAFRGLTILAMVLVNNPGKWGSDYQYWPVEHATWHGWTPTDLIFPFFLFIVGTSLAYSLRKYREGTHIDPAVYWRITRRTGILILLGWAPFLIFQIASALRGEGFSLSHLRVYGVLVRIALVYFSVSLIVLKVPLRGQIAIAVTILLGYWALLAFLPNPHDYQRNLSNKGNIVVAFDQATVGKLKMYRGDPPTDPEGFLSTFPAIVNALLGYWTGLFIQRSGATYRTVAIMAACGLALALIGQSWHFAFPINKKIWTSSFVLLTSGLAMVVLAGCLMKFDIWGWRRLARPYEIVGINAIFVFVGSGLMGILLGRIHVGQETAHEWLFHAFFASWITDPKLASLSMALATVAFWWFVCWVMSRFGWAIRV
jgi:predicted acyltransferase